MDASGSIQKKNGYWYCVINATDEQGKRRQKWISTGLKIDGNKRRAEKILREHLDKYNSGMIYSRNRPGVKFCVNVFRQSQEWRWKAGRILA